MKPSSPSTSPLLPETPVLKVKDQTFEIRFLAQASDDDASGQAVDEAHEDAAHGDVELPEDIEAPEEAHPAAMDEPPAHHDEHADDHGDEHDAAAAHGEHGDGHGEEHGAHGEAHGKEKYEVPDALPNIYTLATAFFTEDKGHHDDHGGGHHYRPWWLNPSFSIFYAILIVAVCAAITRKLSITKPGKAQVALEGLFSGLANFFGEIVGPENIRKYVPFLGSLWLFILLNNYFALIPFFKSPTAYFETTAGLGFCVFIYVNYHGMKAGGVGHYFWHLCGAPVNAVGWIMAPLMFVLELVGTFVKPTSLALRLYGNIFGEDKLLAIFLGLGMSIAAITLNTPTPIVGIPLHLPFLFLSVLLGTIQATVFAMLAAVYIALLLPHHDHEHEHEEAHAAHGEEAHPEHA